MNDQPNPTQIARNIALLFCRIVIVVLLAEQVIYYWLDVPGQSVIGALDRVMSAEWMKHIVSAQMILAAVSLGLGLAPRLIALWSVMAVVSLTSLYVQDGAVIPDFLAVRFWIFIAATTPVVLSGSGGLRIIPHTRFSPPSPVVSPQRLHPLSRPLN
ncbi:hypothetical protein J7382_06160 [Shimia sp. R11_0]|uniref:hypothetical protein n=1 Tax=Shimia sp. R11_0 TaxID=2821096 RepID=UPI001ADB845E|nr:hypothetical protein [Shimia sp. R11_0]MBO9477111.1 hypothetical protein [Shimia sp. R11_0]